MSQRTFAFVPGEFYHVYNRGTDKRTIFQNEADYRRFQLLLRVGNTQQSKKVRDLLSDFADPYAVQCKDPLVAIGAYCLMPNHFHILLTPLVEGGVSLFMQKIATSYVSAFNARNNRTGGLFENKFKALHVDHDQYLKYLFAYIHLNPIKLMQPDWKERGITDPERAFSYVSAYRYSSLQEYLGVVRAESAILSRQHFPDYFPSTSSVQSDLFEWLTYDQEYHHTDFTQEFTQARPCPRQDLCTGLAWARAKWGQE
jgi:putative transposase